MIFRRGIVNTHSSAVLFLFRLSDAVSMLVAGLTTFYAVFGRFPSTAYEQSYLIVAVLSFALLAEWVGLYISRRAKSPSIEPQRIVFVGLLVVVLLLAVHYLTPLDDHIKSAAYLSWLALWLPSLAIIMISSRLGVRKFLCWIRSNGWNQRHVVIVGANKNMEAAIDAIAQHKEYGIQIDGYFDDRAANREEVVEKYLRLGPVKDLDSYVENNNLDEVWIAYPTFAVSRSQVVLNVLQENTVDIRHIMNNTTCTNKDTRITEFVGLALLDINVTPLEGLGYYYKLIEDKVVAAFALALLSPLFAIIAIMVKLSSPGPVFYRQERISWNNRPFKMLKFRSMPVGVEKESGPKWASKGENRATSVGGFLRKTSLDELPQFINVLKGDMSIVGPRPERSVFVEQFKDDIPTYMKKHMVKAGITGWAQVNGLRGDTDLQKRIELDLFYIRNWSLMFDVRIAFRTFINGFYNENAY